MSTQNMAGAGRLFCVLGLVLFFAILEVCCATDRVVYVPKCFNHTNARNGDNQNLQGFQDCKREVRLPEDNLTSPGFPDCLPDRFCLCEWVLPCQPGYQVEVNFLTFDLPHAEDGRCEAAFLSYGGFDHKGRQVSEGRFCGTTHLSSFHAEPRGVWVQFLVTGEARPRIYHKHKGFFLQYKLMKSTIGENQMTLAVMLAILLPSLCCCPIAYFYRKKRASKNLDLIAVRAEARRHKRQLKNALENMSIWATIIQDRRKVECTLNEPRTASLTLVPDGASIVADSRSLSEPCLSTTSTAPNSSFVASTTMFPDRFTPVYTGAWSTPILLSVIPGSTPSSVSYQRKASFPSGGNLRLHRQRLSKLSIAYRAPSMSSISELEEMWDRSEEVGDISDLSEAIGQSPTDTVYAQFNTRKTHRRRDDDNDQVFV